MNENTTVLVILSNQKHTNVFIFFIPFHADGSLLIFHIGPLKHVFTFLQNTGVIIRVEEKITMQQ